MWDSFTLFSLKMKLNSLSLSAPLFHRIAWFGKVPLMVYSRCVVVTTLLRSSSNGTTANAQIRSLKGRFGKSFGPFKFPTQLRFSFGRHATTCCQPRPTFLLGRWDNNCCPVCLIEEENVFHALWGCSGAQDVWGFGPKCLHKCSMLGDSFVALFEFLLHRLNLEQMALMAMVAQKIWFRRNALIFEDKFVHP
jgi:hypothetical protein